MKLAVFLDRDGVLNEERSYITRPEDLVLLPGAAAAVARLNRAGLAAIVVTNQSVVARGGATEAELELIHARLYALLAEGGARLDGLYYCPHHPGVENKGPGALLIECDCRKPAPGMLLKAAAEHGIDLAHSWMVGDTSSDMELARRAGLKSILVATGYGGSDGKYPLRADYRVADLAMAVELIVTAMGG